MLGWTCPLSCRDRRDANRKSFIGADDIRYLLDALLQGQQHLGIRLLHVHALGELALCVFGLGAGGGLEFVEAVGLTVADAFLVVEDVVDHLVGPRFLAL